MFNRASQVTHRVMNTYLAAVALLSFVVLVATCFAAWHAYRSATVADDARAELQRELRRLKTVADELTALDARVSKLAGRVYAQTRRPASPPPAPLTELTEIDELADVDPELAAELELQRAPPVAPGSSPRKRSN